VIRIPLQYSGVVFGQALIDDDCEPLSTLPYYSVTVPRRLRSTARGRPDIILATLKEDPTILHQSCPFVSVFGTQILLVHMVLRDSLARLVLAQWHQAAHTLPILRSEINLVRSAIGRIAYVNGDHTDCRRENLREL
jgi:hypothetical protein